MKLKKVNYKELVLDESSTIKKSTIRPVENNVGYDKVTITPKQVKKSMKFFSRLSKKK